MLRDLGQALIDAISDSSEVSENLRRIQDAGYTLHLRVDCKQDGDGDAVPPQRQEAPRRAARPVFKINTEDLSFLRSIGIDPTRKRKRRRSR